MCLFQLDKVYSFNISWIQQLSPNEFDVDKNMCIRHITSDLLRQYVNITVNRMIEYIGKKEAFNFRIQGRFYYQGYSMYHMRQFKAAQHDEYTHKGTTYFILVCAVHSWSRTNQLWIIGRFLVDELVKYSVFLLANEDFKCVFLWTYTIKSNVRQGLTRF